MGRQGGVSVRECYDGTVGCWDGGIIQCWTTTRCGYGDGEMMEWRDNGTVGRWGGGWRDGERMVCWDSKMAGL